MKAALLVIDVQKDFFNGSEVQRKSLENAVWGINEVVKVFREKKLPVVYVQHMNEAEDLKPGNPGFDLPDAFDVRAEDIRITKVYGNSFNKTGLHEKLQALGVDTLIVTGFCAEWCVLATYRGAEDLDYKPILVLGAVASGNLENLRFVESLSEVVSVEALKALMG